MWPLLCSESYLLLSRLLFWSLIIDCFFEKIGDCWYRSTCSFVSEKLLKLIRLSWLPFAPAFNILFEFCFELPFCRP